MAGRRYWLPRCGARKPILNPDGSIRNGRCRNHSGLATGPRTVAGHARCLEGRIKLYNERKAAGLPGIIRKPKAPAAIVMAPWRKTTEAERKARVLAELKRRWPDQDWN